MAGLQAGFPCPAGICKLNFDAFHIERDGGAAGEYEFQRAVRAFARLGEIHGEQGEDGVLVLAVDTERAHGVATLEGDDGAAALEGLAAAAFSQTKRLTTTEKMPWRAS